MTRRLRLVGVQIVPLLVWDDGETLSPGPDAQPKMVPAAKIEGLAASLAAEIDALNSAEVNETQQPSSD